MGNSTTSCASPTLTPTLWPAPHMCHQRWHNLNGFSLKQQGALEDALWVCRKRRPNFAGKWDTTNLCCSTTFGNRKEMPSALSLVHGRIERITSLRILSQEGARACVHRRSEKALGPSRADGSYFFFPWRLWRMEAVKNGCLFICYFKCTDSHTKLQWKWKIKETWHHHHSGISGPLVSEIRVTWTEVLWYCDSKGMTHFPGGVEISSHCSEPYVV